MNTKKLLIAFSLFVITAFSQTAFAQGLNWEGQTGALITPFAYTAGSPAGKFGKPEVAFHYLNSGSVVGNDYQLSITEGVGKRFEFGFTQAFTTSGSSPLTSLFSNGFSEFHGKLTIVKENAFKTKWVPAIAVGSIGRFGIQRVGSSYLLTPNGATAKNGDFYVVATKTITQVKGLPIVLSLGDKLTDASAFGIAGNAVNAHGTENWQGRLFGAAAFVVKGPAKAALIFGSEFAQQPHYVQGLGGGAGAPTIPTTLSYFVRVVPHLEGSPLQVDLGVAQIAGKITPGVDLQARAQVGMGVSYHF
jgi:hypothetical protein